MEDNMLVCEYKGQYTDEELALLNMEITPEIQALLDSMLMDKAKAEAMMYVPQYGGLDIERELDNNIDLFEGYIALTKEREQYQVKWETLRYARSMWWSLFKEEMEYPWIEYDRYVIMLDKRMREVQPTDEQWSKAMSLKSMIYQRCLSLQYSRRAITYPIYQRALVATKKCQEFWKTHDGNTLSVINKERSAVWNAIQELDCSWEDYNNLIGLEINPYFTNGDTEEVDGMELMCTSVYESLDMLEDASHEEDSQYYAAQSKSGAFWSYREAAISSHRAKAKKEADDAEEAYQSSLVSFMDSYLCTNDTHSNTNGAYTC